MSAADRCPGSLQLTLAAVSQWHRPPCAVCGQRVDVVPLDGALVIVEHRRRSDEALPIGMFA